MPARSAKAKQSAAFVQQGRITEVDATRWLCRVRPDGEDSDITVTIPSLYSHPINGEGIHYLPETGAPCYICRASNNERLPFLLLSGAATGPKDRSEVGGAPGSMDMFRPIMSPGDIAMFTRDGNGLVLRRGGITELRSTALARIMFNPQNNQILSIGANYKVQTLGGSWEWKDLFPEKDPNGGLPVQYSLKVKQFATSKGYSVRLRMGATDEDDIQLQDGDSADAATVELEQETISLSGSGSEYTLDIPRVKKVNDSARVIDFRLYKDELKEEVDLEESFVLGMDREGDLQAETSGATRLASEKWVEFAVSGSPPGTKSGDGLGKVVVTKGQQGSTQPVMLGETFLTDLQSSLLEITTLLKGLGLVTPNSDSLVANITSALQVGAPYLSTTLESE